MCEVTEYMKYMESKSRIVKHNYIDSSKMLAEVLKLQIKVVLLKNRLCTMGERWGVKCQKS